MDFTGNANRILLFTLLIEVFVFSIGCSLIVPEAEDNCSEGPCCDDKTGRHRPDTFKCGATAIATDHECSSRACGGVLLQRFQYQFCDGSSSECGESNLKWEEADETCDQNSLCQTTGQDPVCEACSAVCVAKANGDGTCYGDETEHNNTPDQAEPVDLDSRVNGLMLDSDLDAVDFYSFELDATSGDTLGWTVTATVNIDKVSGGAGHQLALFFADPSGVEIFAEHCDGGGKTCAITYLLATKPDESVSALFGVRTVSARLKVDYNLTLTRRAYKAGDTCDTFLDALGEPSNNIIKSTEQVLVLDTPYAASLCNTGDTVDYYAFHVSDTAKITLSTSLVASTDTDALLAIGFYRDSGGGQLDLYYELPFDAVETGRQVTLMRTFEPGDYILSFRKDATQSYFLAYTFSLDLGGEPCTETAESTEDINDFQSLAGDLPQLGTLKPRTDQTLCANDPDWWRVVAVNHTTISTLTATLTIDGGYSGPSSIIILDPKGVPCSKQVLGTDNPAVATCNPAESGQYYVGVVALEDNLTYTLALDVTAKN